MTEITITDSHDRHYTNREGENKSNSLRSYYMYAGCNISKLLFGIAYKIKYFDECKRTKEGWIPKRKEVGLNSVVILYPAGIKQIFVNKK